MERLVSIKEAAGILQIPAETVRKWCELRQIPSRKLGRHRRIQSSVIEGLMDGTLSVATVPGFVPGQHSGTVVGIRGSKNGTA